MSRGYAVQLGTYANQAKAAKAAASLQAQGYPTYLYKTNGNQGRIWYTVRLGRFSERASAAAMAVAIRKKVSINAVPVPMILVAGGSANAIGPGVMPVSGGAN